MADENKRLVKVSVTTKDGKDNRAVPTFIEVDRGAGHVRVSGEDMIANKGEKTFELRPGERLVIEGYTAEAIAFDKDQAAAFNPEAQKNSDGKIDAPKANEPPKEKKNEQTSATGAKPTETQDSRIKSSPGTTVTPAMASTPGPNANPAPSGQPSPQPGVIPPPVKP